MLHGFLLPILCDRQMLLVVVEAEGAVDRPVMRDDDTAPLAVVEGRGGELALIFSGETPAFLKETLRALSLQGEAKGSAQCEGACE